ncbi:hypothetical protein B0H17DRAFT_1338726 [Mycena rosella]|uniref:Uncharacterized protein n=1 Tax=Mycena rosella TaxID=1033263 RepID=A0AAD7G0F0_MYCRO|nr:hypothetical protein B0H17DRAFT_1338726 [Mycena rosella]
MGSPARTLCSKPQCNLGRNINNGPSSKDSPPISPPARILPTAHPLSTIRALTALHHPSTLPPTPPHTRTRPQWINSPTSSSSSRPLPRSSPRPTCAAARRMAPRLMRTLEQRTAQHASSHELPHHYDPSSHPVPHLFHYANIIIPVPRRIPLLPSVSSLRSNVPALLARRTLPRFAFPPFISHTMATRRSLPLY